jgi:DNA-binding GntR family transcriptional regulator
MVGLVAARFEQDADANPVPVALLDAQDLADPRSVEECGAAPLYLRVARLIERNIRDRRLAVGSLLPIEHELSSSLKVSRQTVRHAIAHLRDQGLLSARKGVGTRVEASARDWRKSYSVRSVADLVELARETEMRVIHREDVEARGRLARELGCRPGRRWHHFGGPRFHVPAETAFCWTEVYGRIAPIVRSIDVLRTAVFVMVEDQAGEPIVEIRQAIHPCVIDAAKAPILGSNVGDLALQITRRYSGTGGRFLLLSHTLLPGDRFSYSMTFHPD